MEKMKLVLFRVFPGALLLSPLLAQAAIDVSDVTDKVAEAVVAVAAVGTAVLGVVVLIAAYRWIKRAI